MAQGLCSMLRCGQYFDHCGGHHWAGTLLWRWRRGGKTVSERSMMCTSNYYPRSVLAGC